MTSVCNGNFIIGIKNFLGQNLIAVLRISLHRD